MPWASTDRPSLALGLLKSYAELCGFAVDVYYLNLRFAVKFLGLKRYQKLANEGVTELEWLFAAPFFGRLGRRELQNDIEDLKGDDDGRRVIEQLVSACGSEESCREIAYRLVPEFIEYCLESIEWSAYAAVGFSTVFAQSLASLFLSSRLKSRYPHLQIIFGGANVDSEMGVEFIRGFPWIDHVVHGEGESSFPELLRHIAGDCGALPAAGVSSRREGGVIRGDRKAPLAVDLNSSPYPDYSDYIQELKESGLYKKLRFILPFESSRGCWWGAKHHCTFCGLNAESMSFRSKTPSRSYDEIIALSGTYHSLQLNAADNIMDMGYFTSLLPKLAAADIDLRLFYEVKANLTPQQLRMLKAAGVYTIQPGIESLNTHVLQLMRKGITAIQNIQLLKHCREIGIKAAWNLLYGFPGETAEDYAGIPRLCSLLEHLEPPTGATPVIFERFSPYHFDRESFGLTLTPWKIYRYLFPANRVDLSRIAYFFDGAIPQTGSPEGYAAATIDAVGKWKDRFENHTVFCVYQKGPGYLDIYDNRALPGADPKVTRHFRLRGLAHELYLLCDETRGLRSLAKMVSTGDGSVSKIEPYLDRLVAQGLIVREEDRFLSLAVRGNLASMKSKGRAGDAQV
jgi:ribosomal peptide maturation radical SAM protein 1